MKLQYYTKPQAGINLLLYDVAPSPNSSTDAKAWVCVVGLCGLCIGAVSEELTIFKIIITLSPMLAPVIFDIYRYQLLPTSKSIQLKIDSNVNSIDDLINRKNDIFKSILLDKRIILDGRKSRVIHKIDQQSDNVLLMQVGSEKGVQIVKEDFTVEKIPSYPNTHVIFDNDPDRQLCLVQHNTSAFAETETVINILERNLNRYLERFQLRVYIKPLFNEYEFWNLIKQYEGRVTRLRFEFIKHNLANIAKTLPEGFKRLQADINSHKATLSAEAPKNGILEISKDNQELNGIVEYSKNGGGDIGIKVKGYRSEFKTSKSKKKVEIDEIEFQSPDQLVNFIKGLDGNN